MAQACSTLTAKSAAAGSNGVKVIEAARSRADERCPAIWHAVAPIDITLSCMWRGACTHMSDPARSREHSDDGCTSLKEENVEAAFQAGLKFLEYNADVAPRFSVC